MKRIIIILNIQTLIFYSMFTVQEISRWSYCHDIVTVYILVRGLYHLTSQCLLTAARGGRASSAGAGAGAGAGAVAGGGTAPASFIT